MDADTIDQMIQDGLDIIKTDLTRLAKKAKANALEHSEVDNLNTHIRLLLAFRKEMRDAHMEEDLEKLNKQDLNVLARQAMEYLKKDEQA